jgi:type II secretory ATPase GspE/PulE/Tfp pilus assembly ATPase PilB-like protein
VDVACADTVDAELDRLISKRASQDRRPDEDEHEELWKASVRAYTARRREEMRAAWCEHHQGQAARLRTALEALIADHEEQAERYRDQPEGAA